MSERITKECHWCGAEFTYEKGPGRPRKYCRPSHRQRYADWRRAFGGANLAQLLAAYGHECYLCGVSLTSDEATIDHVVPLSSGAVGAEALSNLRPACGPCNLDKSSKLLVHFVDPETGECLK